MVAPTDGGLFDSSDQIVGFSSEGKRGIFPSAYVSKLTRLMLTHID